MDERKCDPTQKRNAGEGFDATFFEGLPVIVDVLDEGKTETDEEGINRCVESAVQVLPVPAKKPQ
jgi:hypothetical protein